jgi:lipopolysaccharide transport system permease protein
MSVANRPRGETFSPNESAVLGTRITNMTEPTAAAVVTRIRPIQGWQWIDFGELWQFRELIYFLSWRDVKVRYKQTLLGASWALLQPLLMMVIFTIVFGRMAGVASDGLPYPVFAYAGLLPWTFFATAIANAGNSVIGSERLVTKVYFPRLAMPIAAVGAAVVDFVIAIGLLIAMMVYYRIAPGWGLLVMPAVFGVILLVALGIGTMLAALNVAYRDFRYVIPFMVQFWMFATPTVYMQPKASIGGWLQLVVTLNPMTSAIDAFRAAVLGRPIPWGPFAVSSAMAAVVFLLGWLYFRKVEDGFADII